MRGELPEGWVETTLAALIEDGPSNGYSGPVGEGGTPTLKLSATTSGTMVINEETTKFLAETLSPDSSVFLQTGDLLVQRANSLQHLGAAAIYEGPGGVYAYPDLMMRVRIREPALRWFAWLWLNSEECRGYFRSRATGTAGNMPKINGSTLRETPVRLPPLPEQRRIVAKLDELRARSRKAREALDEVPALLERLKQSVLAAAFRGDLTAEWRAAQPPGSVEPASVLLDRIRAERRARWEQANPKKKYVEPEPVDTDGLPELPEGWCWVPFAALVDGVRSGTARTAVREDTGFRVLRSSAVRPGVIDYDDYSYLPEPPSSEEIVSLGDLLVTRLSGSLSYVGNGALVRASPSPPVAYPDRLFRSRPHADVAAWLELSLGVSFLRRDLEHAAKSTAGHQRISQGDLLRFPVPVPSMVEQRQAVRALRAVMSAALSVSALTRTGLTDLTSLDHSLLAKAFRGELVPQDPNDEPADQLLARIKAEASRTSRRSG